MDSVCSLCHVSGASRTKIDEVTLDALRTRQSLVKGERLVRHEMRAVLDTVRQTNQIAHALDLNAGTENRNSTQADMRARTFVCARTEHINTIFIEVPSEGFATLSSSAMPEATSELGRSKLR